MTVNSPEQARKKWCPMVQTDAMGEVAFKATRCKADHCMMWRWQYQDDKDYGSGGYCGLAGRPDFFKPERKSK